MDMNLKNTQRLTPNLKSDNEETTSEEIKNEMDAYRNCETPQRKGVTKSNLDASPKKHRIMVQGHSSKFQKRKDHISQ